MGATLYIFMGYPGAGKTSIARLIAEKSGAVHLWSDAERHKMFGKPTHSEAESNQLYDALNERTTKLLAEGKSVVFDTNFNFYADRQKLQAIAHEQGADMVVIWVTTAVEIAHQRAVEGDQHRNGYHMPMSEQHFQSIVDKLEPPHENEKVIKIDGAKFDPAAAVRLLGF